MTKEIANALRGYFETLYELNQNLIVLCGVDVIDNSGQYEKRIQDIIQDIPRLVPYVKDRTTGDLKLIERDGLLEFSNELPFMKTMYDSILSNHYEFLSKIKEIRNKFEHKMHAVTLVAGGSGGGTLFDMTYRIAEKQIDFSAAEFIACVKEINLLFSVIQKQIDKYVFQEGKEDYPYYRRLLRFDFQNYNKIYDSDVLALVGASLFPF